MFAISPLIRKKPVKTLRAISLEKIRIFVKDQALQASSIIVACSKSSEGGRNFHGFIPQLQEFIFSMVLPGEIDDVAKEILAGVEIALSEKKKEYVKVNVIRIVTF